MKHYPTYGQSIILLVIWLLCTLLSAFIALPIYGLEAMVAMDGVTLAAIYTGSMLLTVVAGCFLRGDWKLASSPVSVVIILVAIPLIFSLNILEDPLTSMVPINDTMIRLLDGIRAQPWPYFLMTVLAAPIFEEILFRGIILDGYLKNYKPIHGILVSALLFALVHGNLVQGIGAFTLGVIFGWVYWKTNSLIPVIVLHFVNNGIAFAGTVMLPEEEITKSLRESIGNDMIYFPLFAVNILLLAGLLLWLKRLLQKVPAAEPPIHSSPSET